VREKARQASCSSNLKQLGLAFTQYVQDNDERMPPTHADYDNPDGGLGFVGWGGDIYPYVKSAGVFACPDDPTSQGTYGTTEISYAFNESLYGNETWDAYFSGAGTYHSLSQYTSPSQTVELFEVAQIQTGTDWNQAYIDQSSPSGSGSPSQWCHQDVVSNSCAGVYATGPIGGYNTGIATQPAGTGRHTDGANYLAIDGHVKWLRPAAVSTGFGASNPNQPEEYSPTYPGYAAGTANMTIGNGSTAQLTFSPI